MEKHVIISFLLMKYNSISLWGKIVFFLFLLVLLDNVPRLLKMWFLYSIFNFLHRFTRVRLRSVMVDQGSKRSCCKAIEKQRTRRGYSASTLIPRSPSNVTLKKWENCVWETSSKKQSAMLDCWVELTLWPHKIRWTNIRTKNLTCCQNY